MTDFAQVRRNMVDCQLRTFDVTDRAVLSAMGEMPRERFMPAGREGLAYLDQNVCVADGPAGRRHMLAPMTISRMVQALSITEGERVLDVAGGTGFSAALLARLGARVTRLDDAAFAGDAGDRLAGLGLVTESVSGPLQDGAPKAGPFGAILINGAVELRPEALLNQLDPDGGRLACVWSEAGASRAMLYVRSGDAYGSRALFDAAAPLLDAFRKAPAFAF